MEFSRFLKAVGIIVWTHGLLVTFSNEGKTNKKQVEGWIRLSTKRANEFKIKTPDDTRKPSCF